MSRTKPAPEIDPVEHRIIGKLRAALTSILCAEDYCEELPRPDRQHLEELLEGPRGDLGRIVREYAVKWDVPNVAEGGPNR